MTCSSGRRCAALDDARRSRITFFVVGLRRGRARQRRPSPLRCRRGARGREPFVRARALAASVLTASGWQWRSPTPRKRFMRPQASGRSGFRGPGFSWSPALFEVLVDRGYLYDASTLPTYLGPLARAYYFWTARLTPCTAGRACDAVWRRARWTSPRAAVPVVAAVRAHASRDPGHDDPGHQDAVPSELPAVSQPRLGGSDDGVSGNRARDLPPHGTEPSFLLHPLDLLGGDHAPALRFFPGHGPDERAQGGDLRPRHPVRCSDAFRLVNMSTHARAIAERGALARRPVSHPTTAAFTAAPAPAGQSRA